MLVNIPYMDPINFKSSDKKKNCQFQPFSFLGLKVLVFSSLFLESLKFKGCNSSRLKNEKHKPGGSK